MKKTSLTACLLSMFVLMGCETVPTTQEKPIGAETSTAPPEAPTSNAVKVVDPIQSSDADVAPETPIEQSDPILNKETTDAVDFVGSVETTPIEEPLTTDPARLVQAPPEPIETPAPVVESAMPAPVEVPSPVQVDPAPQPVPVVTVAPKPVNETPVFERPRQDINNLARSAQELVARSKELSATPSNVVPVYKNREGRPAVIILREPGRNIVLEAEQ